MGHPLAPWCSGGGWLRREEKVTEPERDDVLDAAVSVCLAEGANHARKVLFRTNSVTSEPREVNDGSTMMKSVTSIPGRDYQNGYQALRRLSAEATTACAAVAFVSHSGAEMLVKLLAERPGLKLKLVARGAPVTEPGALIQLAEVGVEVALVVGSEAHHFHPKLWLISRPSRLDVVSGSGNLTSGGLSGNAEQFECFSIPSDDIDAVNRQTKRFSDLTRAAVPLEKLLKTPFWSAWELQEAARLKAQAEARELEDQLARNANSEVAKAELYEDLLGLYEQTKAEVVIVDQDGNMRPYVATRFKQSIDIGHADGSIVARVHGIVRKPTEGFNHLAEAGRFDLMVESLVLDAEKRYHCLFSAATQERARTNLESQRSKRA
jgi:HKD family nuclease